jgi:hypothetical protein
MRDQWYGDNRDLLKWSALLHVAQRERLSTILQLALHRPDAEWPTLRSSQGKVPLPSRVVRHFRNLADIQRLAKDAGIKIDVFARPFQDRSAYFEAARRCVESLKEDPLLVFFDPDTGLAPEIAGPEHVTAEEIHSVFHMMKQGDVLACYQRARRQKDWRGDRRRAFTRALGVSSQEVEVFDSDLAKDVVLFSVRKE